MASLEKTTHKVCILGYKKLTDIAEEVISEFHVNDVEYIILECNLDNMNECVEEAMRLGCEVFIAGPGNAAKFSASFGYPLIRITIRYIDYALAIRSALNHGCKKIALARHIHSAKIDINMLSDLMQTELSELVYDNIGEIYDYVKQDSCDALIGGAAAADAALEYGKWGELVYFGKESIKDACQRAGDLAKNIYEAKKSKEISKNIMNNSQLGIIVTNPDGTVQMFNKAAQKYTSLSYSQIKGKLLTDFFPNLNTDNLYKGYLPHVTSYKLIEGAMMHCTQEKLAIDQQPIGTLTTIYPDSHNKQKDKIKQKKSNFIVYRWDDIKAFSPAMKKLVDNGKVLSSQDQPTVIIGENGTGRESIAYCIHGSSQRAGAPCITIDLATISPDDVPQYLFGYTQGEHNVSGQLENADGGCVIIKNLALAKPIVQACIRQVITTGEVFRSWMDSQLKLDLRFYFVMTQSEINSISDDLRNIISICSLNMPSLSERPEDIVPLFKKYLDETEELQVRIKISEQQKRLLMLPHWGGQLRQLQSVAKRYAIMLSSAEKITLRSQYLLLMRAIGEDEVFSTLLELHPALTQRPIEDIKAFTEGIDAIKEYMKYSNDIIAEKLGLSRTTLWRVLQKA